MGSVHPWFFYRLYGNPEQSRRVYSWELLRKIRDMCLGPWLCIGDFNVITRNHEKKGGHKRSYTAMERLKQVLDDCNLGDFGTSGNVMTWCGNYSNGVVMERLDRSLCNSDWQNSFLEACVKVLPWQCSDQRPLLVTIPIAGQLNKYGQKKRLSRFHFEEAWG